MHPVQQFHNQLKYTFPLSSLATTWFKFDAATSSTDADSRNTVSAQGTFSRGWNFGTFSHHSTTNVSNPRWKAGMQNSLSGIYSFNHFGGMYFTSSLTTSSQSCTWIVSNMNTPSGGDYIQLFIRSPYEVTCIQHGRNTIDAARLGSSVNDKANISTSNNTSYISSYRNGTLKVNGTVAGVGSIVVSTASISSELYCYTYGSNRGTASVFEIIHMNGNITDDTFNQVESYLKTKWNISY